MFENQFFWFLHQARIRGYKGAYVISFCPICNSKKRPMLLNAYFPFAPEEIDLLKGRIFVFPMCKDCFESMDEKELVEKLKDLIDRASKIDFF